MCLVSEYLSSQLQLPRPSRLKNRGLPWDSFVFPCWRERHTLGWAGGKSPEIKGWGRSVRALQIFEVCVGGGGGGRLICRFALV